MTTPAVLSPTAALDVSLEYLAQGDAENALRYAVPALGDVGAGACALEFVGRAAQRLGHKELAKEALQAALVELTQAGMVAHAVASVLALRELGVESDGLKVLAKHFGAGARQGASVRPPPVKSEDIVPLDTELEGPALLERARKALRALPQGKPGPAPSASLPLWGSMPPEVFVSFAKALTLRVFPAGASVLREGDAAESAFVLVRGEAEVTRGEGDEALRLTVLGSGAIVGEMALITDAPRTATVRATQALLVLEAPREALERAALEVPSLGETLTAFCRKRLVDNTLKTSVILRELPENEREGLAQHFVTKTFEPGERLIHQGAPAQGLHLLAVGQVDVEHQEADGTVTQLATLGPGTCVGEISLVLRRPATASVKALRPSVSMVLPSEEFMSLVRARPTLLSRLYTLAVAREDETLSVIGQQAEEVDDVLL